MSEIRIKVEDRVSTQLFSFTEAVRERLIVALTGEAQQIANATRGAVGGHGTGALSRSVRPTKARAYRDVSVSAGVVMGGSKSTQHGHLFEFGFSGPQEIKAHTRKSILGKTFDVKAYRRTVTYRPHGYLQGALAKRRDPLRQSVLNAISGAATERGFA